MDATGPNAEQITYWNEQSGLKWVAEQTALDGMIAPFGERAMSALGPIAGAEVVDVGCGCGGTSLELGRRVGTRGSVLGVDISEPMLARARERAAAEGLSHVRFVAADAQTHRFGPADAVFSRFGVMFFAAPRDAFANLRAALRPDGRLAFVCWQPVTENPWMLVPMMAAAQVITLPPPPAPDAPGPFQLGDKARLLDVLAGAGFHDPTVEAFAPPIAVGGGGDLGRTVAFVLQLGAFASLLRQAGADVVARVSDAVRSALAPYETSSGIVMPSAAWIVTARP